MKTETQIAKEKVGVLNEILEGQGFAFKIQEKVCIEHKASCQRFLEFLDSLNLEIYLHETNTKKKDYRKKIQDLKQAIKLYDDAGI